MTAELFKIADLRELDSQIASGEISYGKMVEILNERTKDYAKQKAWQSRRDYGRELEMMGVTVFDDDIEKPVFNEWWKENK